MSINFNEPVNDKALSMIKELLGEPAAADKTQFLFDKLDMVAQREMSKLAKAAGQPVTVEIRGQGDIKTMSDGTQYEVTPRGWVRVKPDVT